jgi:hypothetical protein
MHTPSRASLLRANGSPTPRSQASLTHKVRDFDIGATAIRSASRNAVKTACD